MVRARSSHFARRDRLWEHERLHGDRSLQAAFLERPGAPRGRTITFPRPREEGIALSNPIEEVLMISPTSSSSSKGIEEPRPARRTIHGHSIHSTSASLTPFLVVVATPSDS
jgi:hypothetical protein